MEIKLELIDSYTLCDILDELKEEHDNDEEGFWCNRGQFCNHSKTENYGV